MNWKYKEKIKHSSLYALYGHLKKLLSHNYWHFVLHRRIKPVMIRFGNLIKWQIFIRKKKNQQRVSGRNPSIIISMTSYPARINTVIDTIKTLVMQTMKADKIILVLNRQEFRNIALPPKLLKMQECGLEILWDEGENIKSFKKLIPVMKAYPDDVVITVDDDIYYNKNMVKDLYTEYEKKCELIQCEWALRMYFDEEGMKRSKKDYYAVPTFLHSILGGSGTLYPPHSLDSNVFDEKLFLKLCPHNDDLWFWAMAIMNGTKVNIIKNCTGRPDIAEWEPDAERLSRHNGQKEFWEEWENIQNKFPVIKHILLEEYQNVTNNNVTLYQY